MLLFLSMKIFARSGKVQLVKQHLIRLKLSMQILKSPRVTLSFLLLHLEFFQPPLQQLRLLDMKYLLRLRKLLKEYKWQFLSDCLWSTVRILKQIHLILNRKSEGNN